jgi:DNA mismatch repair protein MutS
MTQNENEESLIKQYLDYQVRFEKEYGKNTIVLMQVGAFFEMYGINNDTEKIGNVGDVAEKLNIILTRKKKANLDNNIKNPLMCGFQLPYLERHLSILLENDYTVILIEQDEKDKHLRKITNIYSPGVNINNVKNYDNNNIVSIYIDIENCIKTNKKLMILGACSIDLTTGNSVINQSHDLIDDKNTLFEDLNRFILIYNPIEIILNISNNEYGLLEDLEKGTSILNRKIHNRYNKNNDFSKISYQNAFLSKIFAKTNGLTPLEYLDLEMKPTAVKAYMDLLQFCYEHNPTILNKLNKPSIWNYNKHLILYNDVVYQLDLIRNNNHLKGNSKIKSLFDVLCHTKTLMGKRLLKYRLTNPITNILKLRERYNMIEILINNNNLLNFLRNNLKNIIDIQRFYRKIILGCLHPFQFHSLDFSHKSILDIINYINEICPELNNSKLNINKFNEFIKDYSRVFDIIEMGKYGIDTIDGNFIKNGISDIILEYENNINKYNDIINKENIRLNNLLGNGEDMIKLHISVEKKEYNFVTTSSRYKLLSNKSGFEYDNLNKYQKKVSGNNVKFFNKSLCDISELILINKRKLKVEVKNFYLQKLEEFSIKYSDIMNDISNYIANLDFLQCGAYVATEYGYCKPELVESENAFFDCVGIRHPILERLSFSGEYVTNDLTIGYSNENIGMLLHGTNGSGKSSLSKACGISIIMAQCGFFVPCTKFKYSIYNKMFTRITSDDNLFKGKSSFAIEMTELRSILKFADNKSIILGDEICKGTEYKSALSIIYASMIFFVNKKINFILATHFHKLYELLDYNIEIKNKILFKHLSIEKKDGIIIYGRKIKDGIGDDIYGLEIAKHIIDNPEFVKLAYETRNRILGVSGNILNNITSNYNKELYVDKCEICGKSNNEIQLDTHHIKEQHNFNDNKLLGHIKKDNLDNLVVLCKFHHNEVHHGKLIINGYIHTNEGRYLDYKFIEEKVKTNKKFSEEIIKNIKNKFISKKYTKKYMLNILEIEDNIKLSIATLNKILNDKY